MHPGRRWRPLVKHTVLWSPVANTLHNPVHLDIALASAIKTAA